MWENSMYGAQPEGLTQVEAWNLCGALMIFMGGDRENVFPSRSILSIPGQQIKLVSTWNLSWSLFFSFWFFFLAFHANSFLLRRTKKNRIMSVGVPVALILFMNVEVAVSLCARVVSEVAVRWGCDLARRRRVGCKRFSGDRWELLYLNAL